VAGIFDNLPDAVDAAARLDAQGEHSVFTVINPVDRGVVQRQSRQLNAIAWPSGSRARGTDAAAVQTVLVDVDPVNQDRPGTDGQLAACEQAARAALGLVAEHSGAALLRTGSGAALWLRVDLLPDRPSQDLVRNFLHWLTARVQVPGAKVDVSVSDQCRPTALPGTTKRKLKLLQTYTASRPARPVQIVETFAGQDSGAFERFLRSLPQVAPRSSPTVKVANAHLAGNPATTTVASLCPGWRKILDTIDDWPSGNDLSSSATAWRLVRAMQHRTAMGDDQIARVLQDWGQNFGNSYSDLRKAESDVPRIRGKAEAEPPCSDVVGALGDSAPCAACPEFLYRPHPRRRKTVLVRPDLALYSRPPLGSHLRDPLGSSLDEARWRLSGSIEDAVVWALEHRPTGQSVDVALLYRVGAGIGKTHQAVRVMQKLLSQPGPPRFIYLTESYRTARDVLGVLQGTPVAGKVRLFHPKLKRPLTTPRGEIEGFCERPELITAARADGARSDYQLACRGCPELTTCRYRAQFESQTSYIAVHDHAMSLLGPRADRGNLPTTGIFDEDPRRIYEPDIEVVTEDDLQQLEAAHPAEATALLSELRRILNGHRKAPKPLVVEQPRFKLPMSRERGVLELARKARSTGRAGRLVKALWKDSSGGIQPYGVWVTDPGNPFHAKQAGRQTKGAIGLVSVTRFRLHREVLTLVLDATAHPGVLEAGLGREVIADTDQVATQCEVWQIPVDASRTALARDADLRRKIQSLLRALDSRHTRTAPLGLITYQTALQSFFRTPRSRTGTRVSGYFHGLRGSNEFHDRGVNELVIVGTPVPNLTSFSTLASTYVQEYEQRLPQAVWTRGFVPCGFKWDELDVATAVTAFDDPTMQALLDRDCAAELYQAAFRIRPHINPDTKRIWLVGLQPIWDLPTTKLLDFEQAMGAVGHSRSRGRPATAMARAIAQIDHEFRTSGKLPTARQVADAADVSLSTAKRARRGYREQLEDADS